MSLLRRPVTSRSTATSGSTWTESPLCTRLDDAGLDLHAIAATLHQTVYASDGSRHLTDRCPAIPRRRGDRVVPFVARLGVLESRTNWCPSCATVAHRLATFTLGRVSLQGWLERAATLTAAITALDACTDAAAYALAFERIAEARSAFSAHPCPLTELADELVGTGRARQHALLDLDELTYWARRHAFAATHEQAPLLPGVHRRSLRALGGRVAVDLAFRSWATRRPGQWSAPTWQPWHAHWDSLAAGLPLGAPMLVALAQNGQHAAHLDQLADPTARELYRLELAWLRPHPTVRLLPALAVALLETAAEASGSRLVTQPCADPAAVDVAVSWLTRGVAVADALALAAATVAPTTGPTTGSTTSSGTLGG